MEIKLAPLNIQYLDDYLRMVNSMEVHETTQPEEEFEAFSREKIIEWLSSLDSKLGRKDFAILKCSDEGFVGEVVLNHIEEDKCNLRIALLPEFFGQGAGTQAVKLATDFAFETLKLKSISLDVYNINPRGMRVYEKCGFKFVSQKKISDNLSEIHMLLENKS